MTIETLQKMSTENFLRAQKTIEAITAFIDVKMLDEKSTILAIGPQDTEQILLLLQTVKFIMQQAEHINIELMAYHLNGLENYKLSFADESATTDEKMKLLTGMIETAIAFVPDTIKEYLKLKKERVYSIVQKK